MTATLDEKAQFVVELEADWYVWLNYFFESRVLSGFAPHHQEFWNWVWSIQPNQSCQPFVAIWSRGHGKSSSAELACSALGATGKRNYVLYVSETQDQADKHVGDISSLLEDPTFGWAYPELQSRKTGLYGHSKGWRRNRLATASGFVVDACGLDSAARGIKFEGKRPDLIIIDDVDGKRDSATVTQSKIEVLTTSIFPAGARHATVLAVQNIIHKTSIFAQLADPKGAQFLTDRIISGPHPAIRGFHYEKNEDGRGYTITAGTPTWAGADLATCQASINKDGLASFLKECQHNVSDSVEGALFEEWSEIHHLITETEFADGFKALAGQDICRDSRGYAMIPYNWNLGKGLDYGATVKHPTTIVYVAAPYEYHPLNDCIFTYREITRPQWPVREDPIMPVTAMRLAGVMRDAEAPWQEASRLNGNSVLSHERPDVKNAFVYDQQMVDEEAQVFAQWKPDRQGGVPAIQNALMIDWSKPHPFRKYPQGYKDADGNDLSGQPLMGRPRIYFIVADGQGELYLDGEGKILVRGAIDSDGFARARFEIPIYRNQQTQQGEERNKEHKVDDDFIDAFKGVMGTFALKFMPATLEDRIERALPEASRKEAIAKMPVEDNPGGALHLREFRLQKIKKELTPKNGFEHIYARRRNR